CHPKQPWKNPLAVRLYLHRGVKDGVPRFEDVTEKVGLTKLGMKSPHVEIQDMDNDGWPDIVTSIVKFKDGKPYPVIYRNLGVKDGLPRFAETGWQVNDFPTQADREGGTKKVATRMLAEKKVLYAAAAPTCDFDRAGRLDLFLATWWEETNPLLLRNET